MKYKTIQILNEISCNIKKYLQKLLDSGMARENLQKNNCKYWDHVLFSVQMCCW